MTGGLGGQALLRQLLMRGKMTIRRIVPDFEVADPAVGREFYQDVLGLELAMDMGWIRTYVSPSNRKAQINLMRTSPGAAVPDYSVEVQDVAAVHARAVAAGMEIVYPLTLEPWGVRRFFVRDPHGRVANIMNHATA